MFWQRVEALSLVRGEAKTSSSELSEVKVDDRYSSSTISLGSTVPLRRMKIFFVFSIPVSDKLSRSSFGQREAIDVLCSVLYAEFLGKVDENNITSFSSPHRDLQSAGKIDPFIPDL